MARSLPLKGAHISGLEPCISFSICLLILIVPKPLFKAHPRGEERSFFFLKKTLSSTRHTSSECSHAHTHTHRCRCNPSPRPGTPSSLLSIFLFMDIILFSWLWCPLDANRYSADPKSMQCREASPCVYFAACAGGKRGPAAGLGLESGFRVRVGVRVRVRVRARLLSSPQSPALWQFGVSSRLPAPHHVFLGKRSVLLSSDKSQSQRQ